MEEKMTTGIYAIINIINDKYYIGSAINFNKRFELHRYCLNKGNHHSKHLQRAWNNNWDFNFIFVILENCNKSNLIEREQYWIDKLKPEYNICKIAGSRLGCLHTKETRDKMSKSAKGRVMSADTRMKMSISRKENQNKPIKLSNEHRTKISISLKGHIHSNETRNKISAALKGRKISEETRIKMCISRRNREIKKLKTEIAI